MNPKTYGMPYDFMREGQLEAIKWIEEKDWLLDRTSKKIKVIEAPTGTGKTGLVLYLSAKNPSLRVLVLCATKLEQEQYEANVTNKYVGFTSVKGRNNFHCHLDSPISTTECTHSTCFETHVDTAKCSIQGKNKFICPIRSECAYFQQIDDIKQKKVIVTNYAYGLTMLNYNPQALGSFDLIVSDEGHVLDEMLEQFIQVKLWDRQMDRLYGLSIPDFGTVAQWQRWCEENSYAIDKLYDSTHDLNASEMSKEEISLATRAETIKESFESIKSMDVNWVVERLRDSVEFKPVWVTERSDDVLFSHSPKHIVMSGTIPSGEELTKKVGINSKDFSFYRLPYTFPPENRQIILRPTASMSSKNIDMNLPVIREKIDKIIDNNLDKKILIHTVNYKIARYIEQRSRHSDYLFTHDSKSRTRVLNNFKKATAPAVLISPSFDKAVDLPDKECELIIVAKLPFPYLGSKVMQKRLRESRRYYDHETLATLIQMAGRGVRNENDICPTIILDSSAPSFIQRCGTTGLIPDGIKVAIRREGV
tara:strand:+ start:9137 stop:10741 length:1605 start_codon:yes stop_codon:yes gene_type:complete